MANLGIETSRSLAVIETDELMRRRRVEPQAILVRVMDSHIRYGTFQYVAHKAPEVLPAFTNYVIDRHYPHLNQRDSKYIDFFDEVMSASIEMVVDWLRVGFIHGVMNTDNMSVYGATFDYGPCAFMNSYDEQTVFSSIDRNSRYAFGNQREIVKWNLERFAEALQPLVAGSSSEFDQLESKLSSFDAQFEDRYDEMMRSKLGIRSDGAEDLIEEVVSWLRESRADYTNTFIELAEPGSFDDPVYSTDSFTDLRRELSDVGLDSELMAAANPRYIPRNYLVEAPLTAYLDEGDLSHLRKLLEVLTDPYESNPEYRQFQRPPSEEYDASYTTFCNT